MTLRLNGSASGYTELEAAPVAGNNKITLPASSGSSGQILKNSNGVLDWSQIRENADGSISLVAGTAAAPSLSFTGDSNTGIYSPGADQVAISTGGSGRLFVDASGNVGVATGAPSYRLEVNGTISQSSQGTSSALIQAVNAGGIFYHGLDNSAGTTFGQAYAAALWHSGAYPILFATNGTERLRITSAGLVGIGTSSPSGLLHVAGQIYSSGTGYTGTNSPTLRLINSTATTGRTFGINSADAGAFQIFDASAGDATRVWLDSAGNVGIGTTSADARLTVQDGTNNIARVKSLSFDNYANEGIGVAFGRTSDGADVMAIGVVDTDKLIAAGREGILFATGGGGLYSAATERARIDSSGNVGIGTSSPQSAVDVLSGVRGVPETSGSTTSVTTLRLRGSSNGVLDIGELSSATAGSYWLQVRDRTDLGYAYNLALQPNGGNVGIGTTSPTDAQLYVNSSSIYGVRINHATLPLQSFLVNGTQAFTIGANSGGGGSFYYGTGNLEAARIDSSGRLLVGTSTSTENVRYDQNFSFVKTGSNTFGGGSFVGYSGTSAEYAPLIDFKRSRGTTDGSMTVVASGDRLGGIAFLGADGNSFEEAANIRCYVDGAPGDGDMPGRLVFSTTADGASSPTERVRITSTGLVGIGTTDPGYLLDCQKAGTQFIRSRTNDTGAGSNVGGFVGEYLGGGGGTNTQVALAAGDTYAYLSTLTNAPLLLGVNSVEKARINTSGRLLLGTSSESGEALLQVNGDRVRIATAKTPTSASATGTTGEICWDANYVYVCTATNTWKRVALSTW